MAEIDKFASQLWEEAKRYLEKGAGESGLSAPNLHAAVMLAFCSLEAHVNSVAEEVSMRVGLTPQQLSVLLEKEVSLEDGDFKLAAKSRKIWRLEDRIAVLHRLGNHPDTKGEWRAKFADAAKLRNSLTHPKTTPPTMTKAVAERALTAVLATIDALYRAVYNKKFPAAQRKLSSALEF